MMPFRYEWVSNEEIAVTFKGQDKAGAIPYKLSLINIDGGPETVLEQFWRNGSGNDSVIVSDFNGPYKTVEGAVYYQIAKSPISGNGDYKNFTPNKLSNVLIQSRLKTRSNYSLSSNHVIRWGEKGLFLGSADGSDSVLIAKKPYENINDSPAINADKSFILVGGTLQRLADSAYIVLDTMIKAHPPKTTQCGFIFSSFNPKYNEVLTQIACDDEISYEVNRIATFNYITHKFEILDSFTSLTNWVAPVYSPNGINIAAMASHKACLIVRRVKRNWS